MSKFIEMRNNSIYNDEGANFQIAFLKESLLNKDNIENNFIHTLNKIMEMS